MSSNKKKNGFVNKRINDTLDNSIYKFNKYEDCLSVGYSIIGEREEWIDHTLNYLAV